MQHFLFTVTLIVGLVANSQVHAQAQGRLPDGKAYRTTSDGFEVSDYIAELEVTNQELNSRLVELENLVANQKLREKNSEEVQEQDLTSDQPECAAPIAELQELVRRQDLVIQEQNKQLESLKQANTLPTTSAQGTKIPPQIEHSAPVSSSTSQLLKEISTLKSERVLLYRQFQSQRSKADLNKRFEANELVASQSGRSLQFLVQRSNKKLNSNEQKALLRDLSEIRNLLLEDLQELRTLIN